jgi:hypothetical protein
MRFISRNRFKIFLISAALLCIHAPVLIAQDDDYTVSEPRLRQNLQNQVRDMVWDGKFDELEAMAEEFRTQKSRFPSGVWKLHFFYRGFRCRWEKPTTDEWNEFFAKLEQWKQEKPESVTAHIALGSAYIDYAWFARGGGWARDVTEEGWRLFRERLAKARETLEEGEKLPTKDPELYRALLIVGRGQSWNPRRHDEVFRRGEQLEPMYHPLYFERATYLLPRWQGEPGDVERFAELAANKTKHLKGDAFYTRIAWSVAWTAYRDDFFEMYRFSWPRIKQGFFDIEKQFPNSLWNLNHFCYFACLAGDRETARQLFERIGDKWDSETWKNEGRFLQWKKWAHGESEPPQKGDAREARPSRFRRILRWLLSY